MLFPEGFDGSARLVDDFRWPATAGRLRATALGGEPTKGRPFGAPALILPSRFLSPPWRMRWQPGRQECTARPVSYSNDQSHGGTVVTLSMSAAWELLESFMIAVTVAQNPDLTRTGPAYWLKLPSSVTHG